MKSLNGSVKRRMLYAAAMILLCAAGIISRKLSFSHPCFFTRYFPDTAWAMFVYCLAGFIFDKGIKLNLPASLFFSYGIEISQLFSPPFLVKARQTVPGGLIFGYGFLWSDILCYTAGILFCTVTELLIVGIIKKRQNV